MKGIRIRAKKRWRNNKKRNMCQENALDLVAPSISNQTRGQEKSIVDLDVSAAKSSTQRPSVSCKPRLEEDKRPIVDAPTRKPDETIHQVSEVQKAIAVKEISPFEVVRSERSLGSGTFGTCYLAHYRGLLVAVKEFKVHNSRPISQIKKDVLHEAKMINHLGDHRGLPLLYGIITKSLPLRLITQFHGEKKQSLTLRNAIKKKKFDKPCWLAILKDVIRAVGHVHKSGLLHNDLKSNNVVLESRTGTIQWNPVVIDFGKARFIANPKPLMRLSASAQEEYRKRYPHIAKEIVQGSDQQSVLSDIYSLGKILLDVLDLLPTATAHSLRAAKSATDDDPQKRPTLDELFAAL